MSRVAEYTEKIAANVKAVNDLFDKADKEQSGEVTPEQRAEIIRLNKEAEEVEVSLKSLREQDELRQANNARKSWLDTPAQINHGGSGGGTVPESRGDALALSLGQQFIDNGAFKAWHADVAPGGRTREKISLQSPPVSYDLSVKTLITGAGSTSGGPLINPQYMGLMDRGVFERPLRIRDLVTVLQTNSDLVEYAIFGTPTNAAAPVAEATASGGSSGTKAESAFPLAAVTTAVKTIAHYIPVTRRALGDASQIRGIIDEFLRYGLMEELEDQMVSGDASGENFDGILHISGTTAQAYTTNLLTTSRKARTKALVTARVMPNAWVMHPNDWEAFDLLADNEQRYYFGGPTSMGTPRLWGVPVIESEAVTQGTAILADWRYAVLWDRQQTAIYVTDSHSDWFARNILAILAELRAAFGVIRPAAFVLADLTP